VNTWVQAIGVPLVLGFSVAYLLFVAWASHRLRHQAEVERLAEPPLAPGSEPKGPEPPQPPDAPDAAAAAGENAPHQRSNISTVKK
jgi:hypothetical protein